MITHANLSEELSDLLQERIYRGELKPGERINEVHLARNIGVSRTPLREALQRLVAIDVLEAIPRRGFFVKDLTQADFEDIYPIRAILDPAALQMSGLPSSDQLTRLRQLNADLIREDDPIRVIEIDNMWHFELLRHCRNEVLLDLIRQFVKRSLRYELAYFADSGGAVTASGEHQQIMDALSMGDLAKGCKLLKQNLSSGTEPIITWLQDRTRNE